MVVMEGPTGLMEVLVSVLARRNMVEQEGTLACEVGINRNKGRRNSLSFVVISQYSDNF